MKNTASGALPQAPTSHENDNGYDPEAELEAKDLKGHDNIDYNNWYDPDEEIARAPRLVEPKASRKELANSLTQDDQAEADLSRLTDREVERARSSDRHTRLRIDTISAAELEALNLPQVPAVVPGYVVEGVTILAGSPKIGKSWLVLDLALAVASGGLAFGSIQCQAGNVLYAALEDNPRRLKRRLQKLRPEGGWPKGLHFEMQMARLDDGGLQKIKQWVQSVAKPKLIIIDTFARVRSSGRGNEQQYDADYAAVGGLRQLADTYGVAIVIVHHTRKMDADDPLDTVSGTTGLTGAADTTLVLKREGHGATMYGRGRDIEEIEQAMKFDRNSGSWSLLGNAADVKRSPERGRIRELLLDRGEPMGPKEMARALGVEENNIRQLLTKMVGAGELQKEGRGQYVLPTETAIG